VPRIKRPDRAPDHSSLFYAKAENALRFTYTPPHGFMVQCLNIGKALISSLPNKSVGFDMIRETGYGQDLKK
jgi:hypothetical protein